LEVLRAISFIEWANETLTIFIEDCLKESPTQKERAVRFQVFFFFNKFDLVSFLWKNINYTI